MGMIPRVRMKHCIFGISQYGVHKISKKTGEVKNIVKIIITQRCTAFMHTPIQILFTHRFSDIYQTTLGKNKNVFSLVC